MTKQQFDTGIRMLETEYAGANGNGLNISKDPTRYRLWAKAFMDVDGRLFFMAIEKHIMESEFAPKVASLMKHIKAVQPVQTSQLAPDEAFKKLCRLTRYFYDKPKRKAIMDEWKVQHPSLYKTARNFDINELAMMELDQVPVVRAQFERYYKEHTEREARAVEYADMLAIVEEGLGTGQGQGAGREAMHGLGGVLKAMPR